MKIGPYAQLPAGRQNRTEQGAKNSLVHFNRVLDRLIQQPGTGTVAATAAARDAAAGSPDSSHTRLIRRMERFVGMLEGFRAKLADSTTSLKELHPAAQKIECEIKALAVNLGGLPAKADLTQALQKALTAASMDLARFRSGTYLSQNARASLENLPGHG